MRTRTRSRRRLRNAKGGGGFPFFTLMMLTAAGGVAYLAYQAVSEGSDLASSLNPFPAIGGAVSSVASAASDEASSLGTDLSNSATGISGLIGSGVDSLENGLNSIWQSL